jgi:predicted pyridoxine 5'-phosphate oxidase superfamily flavin-nucleotide-binding protein
MKNTLAENMLRFGAKNLNSNDVIKLQNLTEQVTAKPVTIPYTQTINLKAGVSDAASYIKSMADGILAAVNANAESKTRRISK